MSEMRVKIKGKWRDASYFGPMIMSGAPLYIEQNGHRYVLLSHALEQQQGASEDAIKAAAAFVTAYRPDDRELHDAMNDILLGVK